MTIDEAVGMRQRILDEAARLFVKNGYNGISMREIAQASGVSKAGLYYHFLDKEDLFLVILRGYLDRLSNALEKIFQEGGSTRHQVQRVVEAIFAEPPEERALIRLAGQEMANIQPEKREEFLHLYHDQFIGKIEGLLARGMAAGDLRMVDPTTAAWIFLGMMYPFFQPDQGPTAEAASTTETIVEIFFSGFGRIP